MSVSEGSSLRPFFRLLQALFALSISVLLFLHYAMSSSTVGIIYVSWKVMVPLFAIMVTSTLVLWISADKPSPPLWYQLARPVVTIAAIVGFVLLPFQAWGVSVATILMYAGVISRDSKVADRYHVSVCLSILLFVACFYMTMIEYFGYHQWNTLLGLVSLLAFAHLVVITGFHFFDPTLPDLPQFP